MGDTFFENLFYKQEKQFEKINDLSKAFAVNYCGNTIIRESIFGIVSNYARKRELALEVLRYPFRDDELWAFTFVKKGTIFLCVNTELPMCKQIFATAHELCLKLRAMHIKMDILKRSLFLCLKWTAAV